MTQNKNSVKKIVETINKKLKTNISIGNEDGLAIQRISTGIPSFD